MIRRLLFCGAFAAGGLAVPVQAQLPQPVRAMIDAAVATGDAAKVAAVVEVARQTNPDDLAEIDALERAFQDRRNEIAAAEQAAGRERLRHAALLENWSGKGQVGAFQSSGNSSNVGATVSLALERKSIDWQHKLTLTGDYQRSNGRTSREQLLASYEPRYQIGQNLFAFALAQYERDRFQGFSSRYSVSGGFGLRVLDREGARLAVKAGPAWRSVEFLDGASDSSFGALAGLDFDWRLTKALTLTQDANLVADAGGQATVIVDSNTTSLLATTGLEAKISEGLTTRLSYTVDYNSNPAPGAVSTDTRTRFTFVYGF